MPDSGQTSNALAKGPFRGRLTVFLTKSLLVIVDRNTMGWQRKQHASSSDIGQTSTEVEDADNSAELPPPMLEGLWWVYALLRCLNRAVMFARMYSNLIIHQWNQADRLRRDTAHWRPDTDRYAGCRVQFPTSNSYQ